MFEGGLLHIHHLLNCVSKYTYIYDVIGSLALKGAVVVERGVYPYPSPTSSKLFSQIHTYIYDGIGFLVLKGVVVVERGSAPYPSPELCSQIHTPI